MNFYCGFDFGTSNSTIGIANNQTCHLLPLEQGKPTMRSAIFCDAEVKQWVFGQEGIDRYLEGIPGRLMLALKSVLGSPLMDDKTIIFNEYISYVDVLRRFISHIKTKAEKTIQSEITRVVLGRPVYFHDHDKTKDLLAQTTLENIAYEVGFKEVAFQYEPIAAALTYETTIQKEQLALIIDMGGGTSDFTIIRLHPRHQAADRVNDVLANCGIHIAGTDFDQRLSVNTIMPLLGMGTLMRGLSNDIPIPSMLYHDLTTWHTINNNYSASHITYVRSLQTMAYDKDKIERLLNVLKNREGHRLLDMIEKAKQSLSHSHQATLDLNSIAYNLKSVVSRDNLNNSIEDQVNNIIETILKTVNDANVKCEDISAIFYTGGSSKIPMIRDKINTLFTHAEVVEGDAFGSVGLGLTIDAQRKFSY